MNRKIAKVVIWTLAIAPILLAAYFYNSFPQGMSYLWLPAGLNLIIAILFPRRPKFEALAVKLEILLSALLAVIISGSIHPGSISTEKILVMGVGLMFVAMGDIMPQFKTSFFVTIRNPWTRSNEHVWYKAHKLASILWFVGGVAMMAVGFLTTGGVLLCGMTAIALVVALCPTIMSYVWYILRSE